MVDLQKSLDITNSAAYEDLRTNHVQERLKSEQKAVNKKLAFEKINDGFKWYSAKSKKFDYAELDSAVLYMDNVLGAISKNAKEKTRKNWHQDDLKAIVSKAIKIWEKALKENTPKAENQRITDELVIGIKQNLMYAYFLMDNYTLAKQFGQEIVGNDFFGRLEKFAITQFLNETLPKQEIIYNKYKGIYF